MTSHDVEAAKKASGADGSFDLKQFMEIVSTVGHGKAIGYRYRDHDEEQCWVEMVLDPHAGLVGVPEQKIIASGAVVGLLDACGGAAVWQKIGKFQPIVTIDLRLDYLRPATIEDRIVARCECYKLTKSVAFVRGTASLEDDRPIANVAGTYMTKV